MLDAVQFFELILDQFSRGNEPISVITANENSVRNKVVCVVQSLGCK